MKQPTPASLPARRTRSSTTAARSPVTPHTHSSSRKQTSKSTPANGTSAPLGAMSRVDPTTGSSRFTRSSAVAAQAAPIVVHGRPQSEALGPTSGAVLTTMFVRPESLDLCTSMNTRRSAVKKAEIEYDQVMDKLDRIVEEHTKLTSSLGDESQRLMDIQSRLSAVTVDPASADCRLVKGAMMRRGDRQAQYTRAAEASIVMAETIWKRAAANSRRSRACRTEVEEARQRRNQADDELEEASLKWVASL